MTTPTATEQTQQLQQTLQSLMAQRAELDEKILAIRNTIQGVNLGIQYQKESEESKDGSDDQSIQ